MVEYSMDTGPYAILMEVEAREGAKDPLDILIEEEEAEFDVVIAHAILVERHKRARRPRHEGGCSFPQCYIPCRHCKKSK